MLHRLAPFAAAFLVALSGGTAAAPGGASPGPDLALLSRSLIEGPARAVAFSGDIVVIGTGCGVAVLRSGDATARPAFLPLEGEPLDIIARGSLVYVAAAGAGLVVIDIADPAAPREAYSHRAIRADKLAISGGTLLAADTHGILHVFDLADPRAPSHRETRRLSAGVRSMDADGDLLAIAHQDKASIVRVSHDGSLRELSEASLETASRTGRGSPAARGARKALLRRGVLMILTTAGEVLSWDVSKPELPAALEPIRVTDVADIAAGDEEGMLLTNLQFLLSFDFERASNAASGARVKLRAGKGTALQSLNRYAQPIITGNPAINDAYGDTRKATNLFMARDRLAVVAPFDGARFFKLERGKPKLLGFFPTRGFAISLVAADGILYVANGFDGVRIGRVGRDAAVDWIGHIQTVEARDIALSGTNLFIADGMGGLKAADVTDPSRPKIIGRHASPFFMSALVVRGRRAYCAGGIGGVEIVDVARPRNPKLVWREEFSEVRGIDVDERWLYFSDGYDGFRVYSLGADAPAPVSVLDTPGWSCDCWIAGNVAYLADGGAGISVVDVSDRAKPRAVGSLLLGTVARAVHARGNTLFVAAHTRGVAAIDVSNPSAPSIAAWYDTADDARGIFADEGFVYAASGSGGVYLFRYTR